MEFGVHCPDLLGIPEKRLDVRARVAVAVKGGEEFDPLGQSLEEQREGQFRCQVVS